MIKGGLVSISFREKSVDELINAAKNAGLKAIEWGSDVHVPVGDIEYAKSVREKCDKAGLICCSYGSYFRFGIKTNTAELFKSYIDTAKALGCSVIRVWCAEKGSREISDEEYSLAVTQAKEYCKIAKENDITVTLECHNHTITDEYHSSLKFLKLVDAENLKMYWQPNQFESEEYNIDSLKALLKYIVNVHVFHWLGEQRFPLEDGKRIWEEYTEILKSEQKDYFFLLEFMHDNNLETLAPTAKTLKEIIE